MMVTMGTQDLLTRCPAPSGRRSPPRDQKEGETRRSAVVQWGWWGGGSSGPAAQQGRAPAPPGVARTEAGRSAAQRGRGWAGWAHRRLGEAPSPSPSCVARPPAAAARGGGSVALRGRCGRCCTRRTAIRGRAAGPVPLVAGWARLEPELARPAPSRACQPAISQPSASRGPTDEPRSTHRQKAPKKRERSKAPLPAETQLKKRDGFM